MRKTAVFGLLTVLAAACGGEPSSTPLGGQGEPSSTQVEGRVASALEELSLANDDGGQLLPPSARPFGISLTEMTGLMALFTTSGNQTQYYPDTPIQVLYANASTVTTVTSGGGLTESGTNSFTVKPGTTFYVPIFNEDDSPIVEGNFPKSARGADEYFFGAKQLGGAFEIVVDGVTRSGLEEYLTGPVTTAPLLDGGGTHIITLGVYLAPMRSGAHTVEIKGRANGAAILPATGFDFLAEDFTYDVNVVEKGSGLEAGDVQVDSDSSAPTCTADSGACSANIASNAIRLDCGYQSAIGNGGYVFHNQDTGGSTACFDETALCMTGTVLQTAPANNATVWGAGIGFSLDQSSDGGTTNPYPVTGSGIKYSLSNLPAEAFVCVTITVDGVAYYGPLASTSGTVPWDQFTATDCTPGFQGPPLTAAPTSITQMNVQVGSTIESVTYDFCVTSLSFAP